MRHDDRLATVLRLPIGTSAFARIQWRQLVDLLGTAPADSRGDLCDAAHLRLAGLAEHLPVATRAAILADPGLRLRSPRLVAVLAAAEPPVARAALASAQLTEDQWRDLVPALPATARVHLAGRRDLPPSIRAILARLGATRLALPGVDAVPEAEVIPAADPVSNIDATPLATTPEETTPSSEITGIGAIVQRIEAFRRAREETGVPLPPATSTPPALPPDSPHLPLGPPLEEQAGNMPAPVTSFDFATDTKGRIVWADDRIAPMVAGTNLATAAALARTIAQHQPIRAEMLVLGGAAALAGTWRIDAIASFTRPGGGFAGYIGRGRRGADAGAPPAPPTSDRLRQMLHELRTPVNAIQGFAEIIQQQIFGPTPHEYRALAAAIAADAAHMLAGFEELERYARLDTGAMSLAEGHSDLAACLAATIAQLAPHTSQRGGGFVLEDAGVPEVGGAPFLVPVAPTDTERLCWRLLATLATHAMPGEVLPLRIFAAGATVEVALRLPEALAGLDDEALFHAATTSTRVTPVAGMFGTGFALRLAATEAHAAGGALLRQAEWLTLTLPGLTTAAPGHSADHHGAIDKASGPAA